MRTGGGRLSRGGTPARFGSVRDDEESVVGMDMDDSAEDIFVDRALKFDTVLARPEEIQVTFYAHLPAEAKCWCGLMSIFLSVC